MIENDCMQSQKDTLSVTPIGYIRSVFDRRFGTPRQGALAPNSHATFELIPFWRNKGTFDALESFSHVWLISYFHQNPSLNSPSKVHPPRLRGKSVGVLASRSPHHPNPLGLTLAKLDRVEGDRLHLSGVDLVDGTPIIDIKPYVAEADRPAEFTSGWVETAKPTEMRTLFSADALAQLDDLCAQGLIAERCRFVALVEEVLRLDPRPLSYRERVQENFAVVLDGMDVHSRFEENLFTVESIRPFAPPTERKTP